MTPNGGQLCRGTAGRWKCDSSSATTRGMERMCAYSMHAIVRKRDG